MILNELLHAAAHRRVVIHGDRTLVDGEDMTTAVQQAVDAGLLTREPGRRLMTPTKAGRGAYEGPDRCPSCGEWMGTEWLGERYGRHACRCPCCCREWAAGGAS